MNPGLNIIDAAVRPNVVASLVLANLSSDRLWSLSANVDSTLPLAERLHAYQQVLDKRFSHESPMQLAKENGLLDLDVETAKYGAEVVDEVVENLIATLWLRQQLGDLAGADETIAMFERHEIPAFHYQSIDELHEAYVRSGHRSGSGRPIGVTSCVDEAALFAALVMTGSVEDIDGIVMLASPSHSTVLCWSGEPGSSAFDARWFYGKNRLWTLAEYRARAAESSSLADALERHLGGLNTVVARDGFILLSRGATTLPIERVNEIARGTEAFFGVPVLPDATELRIDQVKPTESLFVACLNQSDAASVRDVIASDPQARDFVALRRP